MHAWWNLFAQAAPAPNAPPATDTPSLVVWGVVLLTTAAVLLVVEVGLPSGGLISLGAAACAVAGLVCLTFEDTALGLWATLAVLIATPFILGFMVKVWPNTPIGRLLILNGDGADESDEGTSEKPTRVAATEERPLPHVGQRGSAKTPLRPVGTCVIGGARLECLAEAGAIDAGADVEVVDVDGNEVRVREVTR